MFFFMDNSSKRYISVYRQRLEPISSHCLSIKSSCLFYDQRCVSATIFTASYNEHCNIPPEHLEPRFQIQEEIPLLEALFSKVLSAHDHRKKSQPSYRQGTHTNTFTIELIYSYQFFILKEASKV